MPDWARDAMEEWARDRGLAFEATGLLPPRHRLLHAGMGVGSHRAGMVREYTAHSMTATGGFTKRPERFTENICRGTLPGGARGIVAHHVHLVDGLRGDHGSWNALPHTVVLVPAPHAVRVVRDVRSNGASGFRVEPEHDAAAWAQILDAGVTEALGQLGDAVDLDIHDGSILLSADQVWQDAARLDWMCVAASRLAGALTRAAAGRPALDPDYPLPPVRDTEGSRWIDEGMKVLSWPEPPASVPAAREAYARALRADSRAKGRKARWIALGAALAASILFAAVDLVALAFGVPAVGVIGAIVFEVVVFLPWTIRGAFRAGRDVADDDLARRSGQFGLEAFARGYADSRGMRQEDRDELRYRLPPPTPGAPLRSWHGRLGGPDGPFGRVAIWIDRTQVGTTNYALVALADGVQLVEPVSDADRSAVRLDAIARRARDQALQERDTLQGLPN